MEILLFLYGCAFTNTCSLNGKHAYEDYLIAIIFVNLQLILKKYSYKILILKKKLFLEMIHLPNITGHFNSKICMRS